MGGPQCWEIAQRDPEDLAHGLRGLPSPWRDAGVTKEHSLERGPPVPNTIDPLWGRPERATSPLWMLPRCVWIWGPTAATSWVPQAPCTPTATEFFMSATAEVNSLKCSSGQ